MQAKVEQTSSKQTHRIGSKRWSFALKGAHSAGLGVVLCASIAACGATDGSALDESARADEATATHTEALESENWRNWSTSILAPTAIDNNPTICGNLFGAYTMIIRNSSRYYQATNQVGRAGFSAWSSNMGSTKFWSSPSCAALTPTWLEPSTQGQFLVAGKGDDNGLYVQLITPDSNALPPGDPPQPPTLGSWTRVGTQTYSGGTNGFPAVASSGSMMLMAFRQDNTIYVHRRPVPFVWNQPWVARAAAPTFPSSAGGIAGTPAITYARGLTNAFVIIVKANDGGLYWVRHNGTNYVDTSWNRAFIPYTVTSDPALEWTEFDPDFEGPEPTALQLTLYFRDDQNKVLTHTVLRPGDFGVHGFWHIDPLNSSNILGSPAALFGGAIESGIRTAVVRGWQSHIPVADRSRSILWVEDYYWLTGW